MKKSFYTLFTWFLCCTLFLQTACTPLEIDSANPPPNPQESSSSDFYFEEGESSLDSSKESSSLIANSTPQHYKNVAYGNHVRQKMDIIIPPNAQGKTFPVVLTIHGGEWVAGDKSELSRYTDPTIQNDCIHVNINYRLISNGVPRDAHLPYLHMIDDIEHAFNFLYSNAKKYHIDTTQAAIAGYSAGAHLALLYAYTRTKVSIPITFVFVEAAPINFLDKLTFTEDGENWIHESHNGHEPIEIKPFTSKSDRLTILFLLTGIRYGEEGWEETWKQLSPISAVTSSSPKTVLFHGSHDNVIPISNALLLESIHPDCTLYEIYGADHFLHESLGVTALFQETYFNSLAEWRYA